MGHGWGNAGLLVAVIVGGALVGCAPQSQAPEAVAGPTAHLVIHDGTGTVTGGEGSPARALDGAALSVGDVVATDADAETMIDIVWSDGPVTRLGPATTFTIGDPAALLGDRGLQEDGITWNRVPEGDEGYAIGLADQGRTTDHGEVFVADCTATPCRIAATGGIGADQTRVSIRKDGSTALLNDANLASWQKLTATPWLLKSAQLDEGQGLPPLADLYQEADPSRAVLDGTYDVVRTTTSWDCTGMRCDAAARRPSDDQIHLTYVIHSDCPTTVCAVTMDTQFVDVFTRAVADTTVNVVSAESSLAWTVDNSGGICRWDYGDGRTEDIGKVRNLIIWQATPSAAEMQDGVFVVTELRGASSASNVTVTPVDQARFPGCEVWELEFSVSYDMVMTRKGP